MDKLNSLFEAENNNLVPFVYSVEPKEFNENILKNTSSLKLREHILNASLFLLPQFNLDTYKDQINAVQNNLETINKTPLIVGFAKKEHTFGWLFGPGIQTIDEKGPQFMHRPIQRSVQASLVVPVWWDKMSLQVKLYWKDNPSNTNCYYTIVDLPTDYLAIATYLSKDATSIARKPKVNWSNMPSPLEVRVGQKAEFLIPGDELWRNPEVYLGPQHASKVIPTTDMKGLHVTFDEIQEFVREGEEDSLADLTIITSAGTTRNKEAILVRGKTSKNSFTTAYWHSSNTTEKLEVEWSKLDLPKKVYTDEELQLLIHTKEKLWSSPDVFIGHQKADEVIPLANGMGVLARFTKIKPYLIPAGEKQAKVLITVVASTGESDASQGSNKVTIIRKPEKATAQSSIQIAPEPRYTYSTENTDKYTVTIRNLPKDYKFNSATLALKPAGNNSAEWVSLSNSGDPINQGGDMVVFFPCNQGPDKTWDKTKKKFLMDARLTISSKDENKIIIEGKNFTSKIVYFVNEQATRIAFKPKSISVNSNIHSEIKLELINIDEEIRAAYPALEELAENNLKIIFSNTDKPNDDKTSTILKTNFCFSLNTPNRNATLTIPKATINNSDSKKNFTPEWNWLESLKAGAPLTLTMCLESNGDTIPLSGEITFNKVKQ